MNLTPLAILPDKLPNLVVEIPGGLAVGREPEERIKQITLGYEVGPASRAGDLIRTRLMAYFRYILVSGEQYAVDWLEVPLTFRSSKAGWVCKAGPYRLWCTDWPV